MFRNRVIYSVNICVRLGVLIFILLAGLSADKRDPLFESIESYLSKYRQSIESDDLTMQNGILNLAINDMLLLFNIAILNQLNYIIVN